MGEIEHIIIENENIDHNDFVIPKMPFLSSLGSRRSLLAVLPEIKCALSKDEIQIGKQALTLDFDLQKGCYATSLLRELMKSKDVKDF